MFYPMLCEPHPATEDAIRQLNGTYVFERKFDGIRAIVAINNGTVTIHNRNGVDITHRYPEIVRLIGGFDKRMGGARMVFDGEILVWDPDLQDGLGDWSFARTHVRDAQSDKTKITALAKQNPATFMAFDMLYDGADLRNLPLSSRLEHLTAIRDDDFLGDAFELPEILHPQDGPQLLQFAIDNSWEGLVAKRLDSRYTSGRSSAWKKIKPTKTGSFIVMGLEPGNGSRADTFGAVYIGVTTSDGPKVIGKVGSGFTDADLHTIQERWVAVETGQASPPVIEVEYQEITAKGSLRFPVFKGIRMDVDMADCTPERQLT